MPYRVGIALLAILVGIEAALLLLAIGSFRLLLLLTLIFTWLLTLDVLLILRIPIGHHRLHFGYGESFPVPCGGHGAR